MYQIRWEKLERLDHICYELTNTSVVIGSIAVIAFITCYHLLFTYISGQMHINVSNVNFIIR